MWMKCKWSTIFQNVILWGLDRQIDGVWEARDGQNGAGDGKPSIKSRNGIIGVEWNQRLMGWMAADRQEEKEGRGKIDSNASANKRTERALRLSIPPRSCDWPICATISERRKWRAPKAVLVMELIECPLTWLEFPFRRSQWSERAVG